MKKSGRNNKVRFEGKYPQYLMDRLEEESMRKFKHRVDIIIEILIDRYGTEENPKKLS